MKKGIAALLLSMTLTFGAGTVLAAELPMDNAEAQVMDMETGGGYETAEKTASLKGDPGTEDGVYTVTINFNANGGSGSMEPQTVSSNATASLTKNGFKRKDYTFTGWSISKTSKKIEYKDGQDVTSLVTKAKDKPTITLYAQWKLNAPKLKTLKVTNPDAMKISYSKINAAKSYELQYATAKNFKKAKKVTLKKGTSSTEIIDFVPNTKYYVRIRSYDGKQYSDWSNVLNKKTKKGSTLRNTRCSTGIEADITLSGSGSGYHAKLVLVTPTSAVSYGIQFDKCAVAPYTNKAVTLIENVKSNAPGQQQYVRPSGKALKIGKKNKHHMMITINSNGKGNVYLDYQKIGSFTNKNLANTAVYPRVEASVRLTGDTVNAVFDNIRLTRGGEVQEGLFGGQALRSNKGIKTKRTKNQNKVTISGKGVGIRQNWDVDYENASGIWGF